MDTVFELKNYSLSFDSPQGEIKAIRGVNLSLKQGEILALVGESGCGKTVLCKSALKLLPKNAKINSGQIILNGQDITGFSERQMQKIRGTSAAMVFQDPMTSLNPTIPVGKQITETVLRCEKVSRDAAKQRALELMELVGIERPKERFGMQPHFFSGGMRQRCVLAIALAANPRVLFADEPTTALDVTVQARILDLLLEVRKKTGISIVFVSHDLGVVSRIADRVAVMYAGRIVETGQAEEVFYHPAHPYTWGLLMAMPANVEKGQPLYNIPGMPPSLIDLPQGDPFACRNPYALEIDYEQEPPVYPVSDTHFAATWLLDPRAPEVKMPGFRVRWAEENAEHRIKINAGYKAENTGNDIENGKIKNIEKKESFGRQIGKTAGAVIKDGTCTIENKDDNYKNCAVEKCIEEKILEKHLDSVKSMGRKDNKEWIREGDSVLEVQNLRQFFPVRRDFIVQAVDDISFSVKKGEIFGLVGESGCGKSTAARSIMGFYKLTDGKVFYKGKEISNRAVYRENQKDIRKNMQIIFQDSAAALNPRMTVFDIIAEPLRACGLHKEKEELKGRVAELLEQVGLDGSYAHKRPGEISGGQRQRVAIARSISTNPDLILADEPIASLDLSIQAQILNLFQKLQKEQGFSFLLIAHDLSVVRHICDRVGVMLRGKLVEIGKTEELFENPLHPYTKALLSAVPVADPVYERSKTILEYDPETLDLRGELREKRSGHFVFA